MRLVLAILGSLILISCGKAPQQTQTVEYNDNAPEVWQQVRVRERITDREALELCRIMIQGQKKFRCNRYGDLVWKHCHKNNRRHCKR